MPVDHQVLPREHVERDSEHETVNTLTVNPFVLPVQVEPVQTVLYGPGKTVVGADLLHPQLVFVAHRPAGARHVGHHHRVPLLRNLQHLHRLQYVFWR